MEQEVESLVPVSNGYIYRYRVGEMGENAERQNGSDRMPSILLLFEIHYYIFFQLGGLMCVNNIHFAS